MADHAEDNKAPTRNASRYPTDLRYLARHEEPPLRLQQQLDERASECRSQANNVQ